MNAQRRLVLGTAGHIDHGKTALVQALTGTDTDRLPEEKARGITIDLGFASLDLTARRGDKIHFSVIDVPGHHAFVRNMLAGAGGIDCVLLVVAADEGPKPQTIEHLSICQLLGVGHGVVALTKSDVATEEQSQDARRRIQAFLAGTALRDASIVEVSSRTGRGLVELRDALTRLAEQVPEPEQDHVLRFPVDRAFTVRGFGTVASGTLHRGTILAGDHLEVQPGARAVRVRGLQMHGQPSAVATAPVRVAVNLSGVEVADLHRGAVLTAPGALALTNVVDAELLSVPGFDLPRHRSQLRLHALASEVNAIVLRYDGEHRLARLRLNQPLLLLPGDRAVLRQPSLGVTVAGARILDAQPLPRLRKRHVLDWLLAMQSAASRAEELFLRIRRRGKRGIHLDELVRETGLCAKAIHAACAPLLAAGQVVSRNEHLLEAQALASLHQELYAELSKANAGSLARGEFQASAGLPAAVHGLAFEQLTRDARVIAAPQRFALAAQHRPDSLVDPVATRLETLYSQASLAPPLVNEAASSLGIPARQVRALLTAMLRAGTLVRLGSDDLLIHKDALETLRQKLKPLRGKLLDVSAFKALTGLSRKHAIPLLEHLDGARLTRNDKGVRTVL